MTTDGSLDRCRVLFAPDYRGTNPYQQLLSEALSQIGVDVSYYQGLPRPLALSQLTRHQRLGILHLHWPDYFFRRWLQGRSNLRSRAAFPLDLLLSRARSRIILTAHNLLPHDLHRWTDQTYSHLTYRAATAVIAHSETAKQEVANELGVCPRRIHVIPHGDLSVGLTAPLEPPEARKRLHLDPGEPYALSFGRLAPYKGFRSLIELWGRHSLPLKLLIAGEPASPAFSAELHRLVDKAGKRVALHCKRLSDNELACLLQGSACAVFNYERILTSGGACLARSLGVPILLPRRLNAVDLGEPDPRVARFDHLEEDFLKRFERLAQAGVNHEAAREWRFRTSWTRVAEATARVYQTVLRREI